MGEAHVHHCHFWDSGQGSKADALNETVLVCLYQGSLASSCPGQILKVKPRENAHGSCNPGE